RDWALLPHVAPDGICLCADNTIWVSNALGRECLRVAEGGEVIERIETSMNCYACMLGDDDRRTLYMLTAVDSHGPKAKAERNGAIEKLRTTVPGAGLP
ncbi:MAG TPA: SMP-30/gluconolactonase/LRE family protein, partial [Acidimicrobiales bacterium]|nr:SMP-30/gluconolactonase/LRE family protein [Acidimicrobiales bacterium]